MLVYLREWNINPRENSTPKTPGHLAGHLDRRVEDKLPNQHYLDASDKRQLIVTLYVT